MISLAPGPHGGDAWRLAEALGVEIGDVLDLSASLNPVAPSIGPFVARHLDQLDQYPADGHATAALAEVLSVESSRLVLTNGGAEAIALLAAHAPVGWVEEPDFSLYRRHLTTLDPGGPQWRSDPHNPTGRLADPEERWDVRDEAFYPLATGRWTRGDEASTVLGSLTKVFACPGLRLGYLIAPDDRTAAAIAERRPRWSVNGLACAVLPDLLAAADLPGWCASIGVLRAELVDVLERHGYVAEPSAANYVWVPRAPGLRDRLLPAGVLVRDGAGFGAPEAVRIAVPDAAGLDRLADHLERLTR
ncbi:MAG: aminotransferase class I/II-fold pyridoxal phosphate-dependent enzyme [Actinomycetota bacterium]